MGKICMTIIKHDEHVLVNHMWQLLTETVCLSFFNFVIVPVSQ